MSNKNDPKQKAMNSKISMPISHHRIQAILAGFFISLGCIAMGVMKSDNSLPSSVSSLLSGMIFSIGLFGVISCKAQLFTGNCLLSMRVFGGYFDDFKFVEFLMVDWFYNLIGTGIAAFIIGMSGFDCSVFSTIISSKISGGIISWVAKGILCNILVCFSVWMCLGEKDRVGNFICVLIPVTTFIFCGFEHSIADMFFMFFSDAEAILVAVQFVLFVSLGNIIGGLIFSRILYVVNYK